MAQAIQGEDSLEEPQIGITYGVFKVRSMKMLTRNNCLDIATAFEFQRSVTDDIARNENPGHTLISKLEEMAVISERSIDTLIDAMNAIKLIGPAKQIQQEYAKIQEATSRTSDTSPEREFYKYFTNEEYRLYSHEEEKIIDKFHDNCKLACERRFMRYSLREDSEYDWSPENLNVVLLGKTGDGKSSTGNTILGRTVFRVDQSGNSVTNSSCDASCIYRDRKITVVDTPGIHCNVHDKETVMKELTRMAFLLRNGVHSFAICLAASDNRFTKDTVEMLEAIKLDDDFFEYCMLIYTKAETELHVCTLNEFLLKKKENMENKIFLEKVHERVVAINNSTDIPAERDRNREAVFGMIRRVVAENVQHNRDVIYTNDLFKRAEEVYRKIEKVVTKHKCHPVLVNASIEACIMSSSTELLLQEFVSKVINVIQKSYNTSIQDDEIQLTRGNEVTVTYIKHIHLIYRSIWLDHSQLRRKLNDALAYFTAVSTNAVDRLVNHLGDDAAVGAYFIAIILIRLYNKKVNELVEEN